MFDEVKRKEGRGRAVRRIAWLTGSTLFHVALVVALASAPAIASRSPGEMVIDVKFVKGQPVPAKPLVRPPVPAAPPPPRRTAAGDRPRPEARAPPAPVIQPREVPDAVPPPPTAPPEEPDPGSDDGVVGGFSGSVEAGSPLLPEPPPPRLDFDERSMTHPVYLSGPSPEYTRRAVRHEVEGDIVLHCVITVSGEVRDCRVKRGLPFMDEAAVEAMQRRRYRPAIRNGKPVEVVYEFRLHLKLPP